MWSLRRGLHSRGRVRARISICVSRSIGYLARKLSLLLLVARDEFNARLQPSRTLTEGYRSQGLPLGSSLRLTLASNWTVGGLACFGDGPTNGKVGRERWVAESLEKTGRRSVKGCRTRIETNSVSKSLLEDETTTKPHAGRQFSPAADERSLAAL